MPDWFEELKARFNARKPYSVWFTSQDVERLIDLAEEQREVIVEQRYALSQAYSRLGGYAEDDDTCEGGC